MDHKKNIFFNLLKLKQEARTLPCLTSAGMCTKVDSNFQPLSISMNAYEIALSIDFGVINTFQSVREFANMESMNNDDRLYNGTYHPIANQALFILFPPTIFSYSPFLLIASINLSYYAVRNIFMVGFYHSEM